MVVKLIERMLRPLDLRIRALASNCTINLVDDTGAQQSVSVSLLSGERLNNAIRRQPFGLSANPPPGSVGLAISIGGSRTHTLVLGAENGNRPRDLPAGATRIYDDGGSYVQLNNDGTITAKAANSITLDAPTGHATGDWTFDGNVVVKGTSDLKGNVTAEADLAVDGKATVQGALSSATSVSDPSRSMADIVGVFNVHGHPAANDPPSELIP